MKILHYSLGLPPYRSGGLTKYSLDMMLMQVKEGHDVSLLYPGTRSLSNKILVKNNENYKKISVFELINPLPVSLMGGIIKPSLFMKPLNDSSVYKQFLLKLRPNVIHIHTLMGIHCEFIQVAKKLGIRIIFTSHDYYGICPKVNLVDYKGNICNNFEGGLKCISCNANAYSIPMIYFMQSHMYKKLKNNKLVKKLRMKKKSSIKKVKVKKVSNFKDEDSAKKLILAKDFSNLRKYYINMLGMMDTIHFNSEVARKEYYEYISTNIDNEVIPITHGDITDQRKKKIYDSKKPLKIGFLGPVEEYKGLPLLRKSLSELLDEGEHNWHLHVYGNDNEVLLEKEKGFISFHGRYEYKALKEIFDKIDVLIIPSIWKETFGFIGLEALSCGVPIIVTDRVGFKDLVNNGINGLVIQPEEKALTEAIKYIIKNRDRVQQWNHNICSGSFDYIMSLHTKIVEGLYKKY